MIPVSAFYTQLFGGLDRIKPIVVLAKLSLSDGYESYAARYAYTLLMCAYEDAVHCRFEQNLDGKDLQDGYQFDEDFSTRIADHIHLLGKAAREFGSGDLFNPNNFRYMGGTASPLLRWSTVASFANDPGTFLALLVGLLGEDQATSVIRDAEDYFAVLTTARRKPATSMLHLGGTR
jgi:hypothetical protein